MKMVVTDAAIATIAHTGYTSPVVASGMPNANANASATLCRVRRVALLADLAGGLHRANLIADDDDVGELDRDVGATAHRDVSRS
jgi:hypothetical protein